MNSVTRHPFPESNSARLDVLASFVPHDFVVSKIAREVSADDLAEKAHAVAHEVVRQWADLILFAWMAWGERVGALTLDEEFAPIPEEGYRNVWVEILEEVAAASAFVASPSVAMEIYSAFLTSLRAREEIILPGGLVLRRELGLKPIHPSTLREITDRAAAVARELAVGKPKEQSDVAGCGRQGCGHAFVDHLTVGAMGTRCDVIGCNCGGWTEPQSRDAAGDEGKKR